MLIHEISNETGLTKKAILYYVERGIINPATAENGYRNFTDTDAEVLRKVSVLRKLSLDISEIKKVLTDASGEMLRKISLLREIKDNEEQKKKLLLSRLSNGEKYTVVSKELQLISSRETILEKLLFAFPGYYGRMLTLHFSQYLNDAIQTAAQQEAFTIIISFLDNAPAIDFPKDVQLFLDEIQSFYTNETLKKFTKMAQENILNIHNFLETNKEQIDEYTHYKESTEYKSHPVSKFANILKEFNETSGYYDIFIPAMKQLSPSYFEYCKKLEAANEKYINKCNQIPDYVKMEKTK